MSRRPKITFLTRDTYRGRRVRDAARLLPILGAVLFILPVVWAASEAGAPSTARGFIYIFSAWMGLIVLAVVLAQALRSTDPEKDARDGAPPE